MGESVNTPSIKRAFFLDRDGTINVDHVYINDPDLIELLPGAAEALKLIKSEGYKAIVITNQSGIGRGLIELEALVRINQQLDVLLEAEVQESIDSYEICPHRPDELCDCRKPKAKLVKDAAVQHSLDLQQCFFVGDKETDVEAGHNAGCISILVRTGKGKDSERLYQQDKSLRAPHYVADDLGDAVAWALQSTKNDSSIE